MFKKHKQIILIGLVALAIFLRIIFFLISIYNVPVSSDESIAVLQAKRIWEGDLQLLFWGQPYAFPLESYLIAPIVNFLPRNAFGARVLNFILGCITMIVWCKACFHTRAQTVYKNYDWTVALFFLFPSSYYLILQAAYFLPEYTSMIFIWSILTLTLANKSWSRSTSNGNYKKTIMAIVGFLIGVTCSNILLFAPVAISILIYIVFSDTIKKLFINAFWLSLGLAMGLVPLLLVLSRHQEARVILKNNTTVTTALHKMWDGILISLPGALGINPPLFPDLTAPLWKHMTINQCFAVIFVGILIYATFLSLVNMFAKIKIKKQFRLTIHDLFVLSSWLGLYVYIVSSRSHKYTYRYMITVAISFPFLVSYVYQHLFTKKTKAKINIKIIMGVTIIILFLINNLASSIVLMTKWAKPSFPSRCANIIEISPALSFLKAKNIDRCYAPYWLAYRIDYATDEKIICAQPSNLRFPRWPLPYKREVDASETVAFLLAPKMRFTPKRFSEHLKLMGVEYNKINRGGIDIFYNFKYPGFFNGTKIDRTDFTVIASANSQGSFALNDGNLYSHWNSNQLQKKGMYIDIILNRKTKLKIARIAIYYTSYPFDLPNLLDLKAHINNRFVCIKSEIDAKPDVFDWYHRHPVYGRYVKNIQFNPTETTKFRIEIQSANRHRNWAISEIELFACDN